MARHSLTSAAGTGQLMTLGQRDSGEGFFRLVLRAGPAGSATGDSADVPRFVIIDAKAIGSLEVKADLCQGSCRQDVTPP